jgi:oxygen-dependent protoporphyrinogen oxidase
MLWTASSQAAGKTSLKDPERENMIVVVGAGISGLSAAWFLHGRGHEVCVLESGDQVGGVIESRNVDGYLVERGPNSTLRRPGAPDDAMGRLVQQVGLAEHLIGAAPEAKKRYVMRDGRLLPLPGSPLSMITTDLFSWKAKLRLLREPLIGKCRDEETIAQFVERRLGRELLDYAVDPFISGVYAGDPRELSVWAATPKVLALEREHGSLIRGAIAKGSGRGGPAGQLVSFDRGMSLLPETVAARMPQGGIETNCRVEGMTSEPDGWRIRVTKPGGADEIRAAHVVLAVQADAAARLIEPLSSEAAGLLRTIPYAPVVSAGLGYARDRVGHPLDGFGFLVPRREGMRSLGGLFSSTLFPGRAPSGNVLITAFIGGMTDPEAVSLDDDALVRRIGADMASALNADEPPALVHLTRYQSAIPQYTLGHLDRVGRIEALLAAFPGLHLRASWRDGISVADCIRNGETLAERLS